MARSTASMAAVFLFACLIFSGVIHEANATITCGQVASALGQCIGYLTGKGPLSPKCCPGVQGLNAAATNTPDRQTACACLKSLSARLSGLNPNLAAGLPRTCGVSIPYPISATTDCSRVH